ncbi:exosporium leader peptide-containing protein [Bacillus cereus]|uniref:exosporium leader peptide-containing protein n=1 Tax=Bacillus cereus TaxID=1396 RepID=UPI0035CC6258
MDEFLSSAALNPGSVGPTLPPMQPFQFRTGPTGSTGAKGAIGNTEPYWHTGPPGIVLLTYNFKSLIISFAFRILPIS